MNHTISFKWSPELVYIVGLITTDGSLSKDKRHINFTSSDLQLLRTFKKCLSLRNKISRKHSSFETSRKNYQLQFSNVKFYSMLLDIGLMPNKTFCLGRINIPQKYFRDFLRGHLDGDGSIFTYIDRYMAYKRKRYTYKRLYTVFNSASGKHLKWIQESIKERLGFAGALSSFLRENRKFPLWKLRFAKKDSLKLLSWLYYKPELPCLIRKRKIAQRFIKNR